MTLPVILRPEAEADIQDHFRYLEEIRVGLGGEFSSRLGDVFERIEAMRQSYGVVWQDVRAARLRKFRYVLYYRLLSDRVEVLAVLRILGSFHNSSLSTNTGHSASARHVASVIIAS